MIDWCLSIGENVQEVHQPSPLLAMQQVLENLDDLPSSAGAKDIDLIFLRGVMQSPVVRSLAKVTMGPPRPPEHGLML